MNFFNKLIKILQFILPSPFSIAIILTFITIFLALIFTSPVAKESSHFVQVISFWEKGFWELLAFAMQMMLMLVLGHVLALTPLVDSLIKQITKYCTNTSRAAIIVAFYLIGKNTVSSEINIAGSYNILTNETMNLYGAEKLDASKWFMKIFAIFIIGTGIIKALNTNGSLLNLNYINFVLFGLGLLLHQNLIIYQQALKKAITGASGIMIQFPLYAGIMGIMKYSGLTDVFTNFFVSISNQTTFPIYTFFSAGMVNMFVPSGGGQWAVQGPVLVEAAAKLSVSIPKIIMAFAYGDQITNMMQPFWALPLLGITGLKAKQVFPYTFMIMIVASIMYILGLLLSV